MFSKLYSVVARSVEHATWLLTAVLVTLVTANVFARYALEVGLLWAEEVSRLLFVWVVFLGSWVALRRKAHMAIDVVAERLPAASRAAVVLLGQLCVLVFLCVVAWAGYRLVMTTLDFGRATPILGISAAWGYLAVPVAAALMALEVLRELIASVAASARTGAAAQGPLPHHKPVSEGE
ncbi:TRAP transporter small permease [Azospirillum sp. Marseille-Q6669]